MSIRSSVNRKNINSIGSRLITTRQVKAARALLGWSQGDLARHSSISEPTIARLESVDGQIADARIQVKKSELLWKKLVSNSSTKTAAAPGCGSASVSG